MRKRCECGGKVKCVEDFGRKFSWCESCTPVVEGKIPPLFRKE